jgi:hypothetical protein
VAIPIVPVAPSNSTRKRGLDAELLAAKGVRVLGLNTGRIGLSVVTPLTPKNSEKSMLLLLLSADCGSENDLNPAKRRKTA